MLHKFWFWKIGLVAVFIFALMVKFDLWSQVWPLEQRSLGQKMHILSIFKNFVWIFKNFVWIYIIASKQRMFEIFNLASEVNFDLGGQSLFWSKDAPLIKEFKSKNFVWISLIAIKLWMFEIFNLASEVNFDLGGQS